MASKKTKIPSKKIKIDSLVFLIKIKSKRYHLQYYDKSKRLFIGKKNRTTGLLVGIFNGVDNLDVVIDTIIPDTVEKLTGRVFIATPIKKLDNFVEFTNNYFKSYKMTVRIQTYKKRYFHYLKHIEPYFKNFKISDIRPLHIENWMNNLLTEYKVSTVKTFKSVLNGIFQKAYENEIISSNPMKKVPSLKRKQKFGEDNKVNPFSREEIDAFLALEDDNVMLKNFVQLAFWTGIRPGESISLKWSDFDSEKKQLNIDKTTVAGVTGHPKTPSSVRKIDLFPKAIEALENQYKLTAHKSEYVFLTSNNKPFFSHDTLNISFKRKLKLLTIPIRPLYNLRSSYASMLISYGIDFAFVSHSLGHASLQITMEKYAKYVKESDTTRLNKLEKFTQIIP